MIPAIGPGHGEPTGPVQSVGPLAGVPLWPEGSAGSTSDCKGAGKGYEFTWIQEEFYDEEVEKIADLELRE